MNPSSVPSWNERRFSALTSISPSNRTLIISTPEDFTKYIVGLASLLGEVNVWSYEQGALSATQIADAYNDRTSYVYDLCALILSCIENDSDVRGAISSIAESIAEETVGGRGTPDAPSVYDANPSITADCGLDNLFGAISQLVDLANTLIEDLLERFTATVNSAETLAIIIEAIPIVETLPLDEAFEFGVKIVEDFQQVYEASYDSALRDEYRCELFCEARVSQSCELSFTALADYFMAKAGASILNLNFNDFVEYFTQGTFSGVEVVHAMHALLFGVIGYGAKWAGVDVERITRVTQSFLNDPDNDWSTLCDCGFDWVEVFDFTQGEQGWTGAFRDELRGEWVSGQGWRVPPGNNAGFAINSPTIPSTQHTEIEVFWSASAETSLRKGHTDSGTPGPKFWIDNAQGATVTGGGSENLTEWTVTDGKMGSSGNIYLTKLIVRGNGTNPY